MPFWPGIPLSVMATNWISTLKQLQAKAEKRARLVTEALQNQWLVVAAAIWLLCCSGSSYNYGLYSESIKSALHYDQSALNTLATFKDLGANIGVISGCVFDYSSPGGVLALGALLSGSGYAMLWGAVTGWIPARSLWQTCAYIFLAANGQTFFSTACVVTCVQYFPNHRGIVIGMLKGFLGLSGALLTQLFRAMYPNDDGHSFLILVSWLPSLMALLLMPIFRSTNPEELQQQQQSSPSLRKRNSRNFYFLSAMALVLTAYLMVVIVLESVITFSQAAYVWICAGSAAALLFPVMVAFKSDSLTRDSKSALPITAPWLNVSPRVSPEKEPLLPHTKDEEDNDSDTEDHMEHLVSAKYSIPESNFLQTDLEASNSNLSPESSANSFENKKFKTSSAFSVSQNLLSIFSFWKQGSKDSEDSSLTRSSNPNSLSSDIPKLESRASSLSQTDSDDAWKVTPAAKLSPRRGDDHTFMEAFSTADFWLMFMGVMCGQGCGLTAIDNLGQIGTSLGYSAASVGTFISLMSVWNFLGRFGFGAISEIGLHRFKIGRAKYLIYTQVAMCLAHLCIGFGVPGCLYGGSIIIGLSYGAQWSLVPSLASELFGLKRFATLYNSITIASPIGVYLLSVQSAGRLYDMEASSQAAAVSSQVGGVSLNGFSLHHLLFSGAGEEAGDCSGAHCFRVAFILLAFVSLLGAVIYSILARRTAAFYAHEISERLLNSADPKRITRSSTINSSKETNDSKDNTNSRA